MKLYIQGKDNTLIPLSIDLSNYYTKDEISVLLQSIDLSQYALTSEVEANIITDAHIADESIHVTLSEKEKWNNSASEEYVDTAVANLIDSAPETLNTLNELATAIQENDNVIDTLNAAITDKANKPFVIIFSSNLTADKTYEEVKNAYENNLPLKAYYSDGTNLIELNSYSSSENDFSFGGLSSNGLIFYYADINSSITSIDAIYLPETIADSFPKQVNKIMLQKETEEYPTIADPLFIDLGSIDIENVFTYIAYYSDYPSVEYFFPCNNKNSEFDEWIFSTITNPKNILHYLPLENELYIETEPETQTNNAFGAISVNSNDILAENPNDGIELQGDGYINIYYDEKAVGANYNKVINFSLNTDAIYNAIISRLPNAEEASF